MTQQTINAGTTRVCLLLLLTTAGCQRETPPLGVLRNDARLKKVAVAMPTRDGDHLLDLALDQDKLLIMSSRGAVWLGGAELTETRAIRFQPEGALFPGIIAPLHKGAPSFVGSTAAGVVVYNAAGAQLATMPAKEYAQVKAADLVADDSREILIELENGRGVDIRDAAGKSLGQVRSNGYLTHFETAAAVNGGKANLVLYTYPHEGGAGAFAVVTPAGQVLFNWSEEPAPGRFAVGNWFDGTPFAFYLKGDVVVFRSLEGKQFLRLNAPQGHSFRSVFGDRVGADTVLLASGRGSFPFHMVSVYNGAGQLIFQEIGPEHGYGVLAPDRLRSTFFVATRTRLWKYTVP